MRWTSAWSRSSERTADLTTPSSKQFHLEVMAEAVVRPPRETVRAATLPSDLRDTRRLEALEDGPEPLGPVTSLVRLAVEDDDPQELITAAAAELGWPLGLVAGGGEVLGHAPDDAAGRSALAIAGASAVRPAASVPPGWRVVRIAPGTSRVAVLAVGATPDGRDLGPFLDLVVALLGEQLVRATLRRGQAAAFLRRLISEPGLGPERACAEASEVGLVLSDAYWPAVLSWGAAAPAADVVERVDREARRLHPGGLTAAVSGHMVLLHPGHGGAADVTGWLEQVVTWSRDAAPSSHPQVVASEAPVALADLGAAVTRLRRLSGYGPRAERGRPVVHARQYALERLLGEVLASAEARTFVDELLGRLIAWDREHRSDLLRVLESALDCPRHDQAARRCYMHRNTFRLRLRKALLVLGDDLEDPDIRLAVHVALRLRRMTASAPGGRGRRPRPAARAAAGDAPPTRSWLR
jgi:hypothetical protein